MQADQGGTFPQSGDELKKSELRKIRRMKAENYRNRYLLPRFVLEENGTKRKLEPGEFDANSQLYPITTPIHELSDFGIGIGMYFTTTLWLGLMMVCCGIIQLPIATYFNSNEYDKYNHKDNVMALIGSASCSTEQRVCLNENCTRFAGRFNFGNGQSRDGDSSTMDDGTVDDDIYTMKEPGLRLCELKRFFGVVDLIMMLFIITVLMVLARRQDHEAEVLDLSEQTAQDYSVIVEDPNPDKIDPDEWESFFKSHFGDVFMVTVTLNNGKLIKLLKQKYWLMNEMKLEEIEESQYKQHKRRASHLSDEDFKKMQDGRKEKTYFKRFMEIVGADKTLDHFIYEIARVNREINTIKHHQYQACKVFVIFNHERSQRACLEAMSVGLIPALLDWGDQVEEKYQMEGNLMHIKEAPEPSDVIYENLDTGLERQIVEQAISWFAVGCLLTVTYFTVVASFNASSDFGAIMISLWNGLLPEVNRVLVQAFESHHTWSDVEDSFLAKTVCCRWFTSSLILYFIGLEDTTLFLSPFYITLIQKVLLADALTNPIIRVCDVSGNLKRYVLAPISGTDARAKALNEGTDWLLAERYTDLAKTILMSLFFSALLPTGFWYSALACLISFWVDKFCILRLFRQKPPSGDKLVRITRTAIAVIVLIHCVITAHFYYGWPFDNLCPTKNRLVNEQGLTRDVLPGVDANSTVKVYKDCEHMDDGLLPPTDKEPWFQGDDQQNLVKFYNAVSIFVLVFICVVYFGQSGVFSIYSLFFYKHKPVGDFTDILYDTVDSGEGYVPQFKVKGLHHTILCCTCVPNNGSATPEAEFDYYLLNWTASKEEEDENGEPMNVTLSHEEQLEIYHGANAFFDDSIASVPDEHKYKSLLSRAKQYIRNETTARRGSFRKSIEGKAEIARRKSLTKNGAGGENDLEKLADQHDKPVQLTETDVENMNLA